MKKIVIVSKNMYFGGVEKCLVSMIKNIPRNKYDITLLLMRKKGELLSEIPEWVKVEEIPNISKKTRVKVYELIKQFKIISVIKLIYNLILSMKSKSICKSYIRYARILPKVNNEYDLAISYYNPTSFPVIYTMNNIIAEKKVMWIHSDVNIYKDISEYKNIYKKYDKIYNVSKEGSHIFINKFPYLANKVETFFNLIDQDEIQKKSIQGESFDTKFDGIKILTVGRLSIEKGQDIIPKIVKQLREENKKVKWYLIGDGDLRKSIEEDIKKYRLEDDLILLGSKNNPYSYMKDCDIYVQPSRNECYCTTVTEAKCFKIPIVVTDVNGTNEQINNYSNGLIVDINENSIFEGIKELIENPSLRKKLIANLKREKISTLKELNKLYCLLDGE